MSTDSKKLDPENEQETPETSGKQTPLQGGNRKTGQGTNMDTREDAEPEAPGARSDTAGAPNQGTEAR